jgi:hypothetical protein
MEQRTTTAKPKLILDLDDVFLHNPTVRSGDMSSYETFVASVAPLPQCATYRYLTPAYYREFLRFARDKFDPSFFSSGAESRNREIAIDLWQHAFCEPLPESVRVLSRDHLISGEDRQPPDTTIYGDPSRELYWYGNRKKDVTLVGERDNTVLMDDQSSYTTADQTHNLLLIPGTGLTCFKSAYDYYTKRPGELVPFIERILKENTKFASRTSEILAFYKLVYAAGVLDLALEHSGGVINGLYEIQWREGQPNFHSTERCLSHYVRGYRVLSHYAHDASLGPVLYPEVELYISGAKSVTQDSSSSQ